jgi:hypothetical protein
MFNRVLTALAVLPLAMAGALAQQTVQSGPWSIVIGAGGPDSVSYEGRVLLRHGQVVGYLPNWAGGRFSLNGGQTTTAATGVVWARQVPDNQDATLTVTGVGDKLTLALETTLRAAGPTEYSVEIVPEAVRVNDKYCFISLNGKPGTLDLVGQFAPVNSVEELRFEQPERTVIVRCQNAMLQDRRDGGGGLFLVFVLNGEGKPQTEKRSVEIEVQQARPEEVDARRAMLAQTAVEQSDVAVANAGFEEGLKGWSDNPRAAADAETKHSGNQSARVTIPVDQTDRTGIYLVQQIPVAGGLLYSAEAWVRTQDVVGASLGEMFPTGATVILEWADKDGKWLASGDYAQGSYGTTDWRRVSTKLMRSPKEAGYAIVFLSMRATGIGWFDDVKLTQVKRNVLLRQPASGATVADNTPEFGWQYQDRADAALELSQDEAFPTDETLRFEGIQQSPFGPEKPIAPGKWCWRMSIPDHATTSAVWQFEQTAPPTQDCTPPKIVADHAHLATARQAVMVRYEDGVGVTEVVLRLDGQEVNAKVGPTSAEYTPPTDWQPGLHRLDVEAQDAAGNRATRRLFLNYAPGVVNKRWLVQGGVEIDGKPQFLLGMYGVLTADLPEMAKAGHDFVHNYTWDGAGSNESALEYLDECGKLGLQAFIGFDRQKLQALDEDFVAERVGALCRHPALLAWYLFDEPDLPHQYVPPGQLRQLYRLIKTLDPSHPVIVTVAQPNLMPLYHDSYDVYWSMDYSTPANNVRNFERHREALRPAVPMMSIVHCYDRNQQGGGSGAKLDPEKFEPGPAMLRACAFMAVAHNSSGLCWWWWGQGGNSYMTVAHAPKAWEALKETARRLKELRPVLEAQVPARMWIEKPAEDVEVHLWEKKLPDRTVILAVNRDNKVCEVSFASPTLTGKAQADVLFENRTVALTNGQLRDRFEPLAVHVYELR